MKDSVAFPDMFEGTSHIVRELEAALSHARSAVMNNMAYARMERSLDGMVAAQAEVEKLLAQSQTLSQSLGKVLQFHENRRKGES